MLITGKHRSNTMETASVAEQAHAADYWHRLQVYIRSTLGQKAIGQQSKTATTMNWNFSSPRWLRHESQLLRPFHTYLEALGDRAGPRPAEKTPQTEA